jgi:hypothetical protein
VDVGTRVLVTNSFGVIGMYVPVKVGAGCVGVLHPTSNKSKTKNKNILFTRNRISYNKYIIGHFSHAHIFKAPLIR